MLFAPIPKHDEDRVSALHDLAILDTPPEERFDAITKSATEYLRAPISTISLIDRDREWYKSRRGIEVSEGKRSISFCGHTLFSSKIFIVEDTLQDDRFSDNPYVAGTPHIRAYMGVTLHDRRSKQPIGVFCVKDVKPRHFEPADVTSFIRLAKKAEEELNAEILKHAKPKSSI